MTRGVTYSKPLAVAAMIALGAAGTMLSARLATEARLSKLQRDSAADERALQTRIAAMSDYETENVASLRREVSRFRVNLAAFGTWESLVASLGSAWDCEPGPKDERNGYSIQLGTLRLLSHAVGEWPEIVNTVGRLEALPGVGIAELEMKTSGTGDRRSLETTRILVVIQASREAAKSTLTP
jgi:hypothetical protein